MTDSAPLAALVVAAGRGTRLGGPVPKQYRRVAGRPVLTHTLGHLLAPALFEQILVVIHPDDGTSFAEALAPLGAAGSAIRACAGGASRQDSVRLGLEALAEAGLPDRAIVPKISSCRYGRGSGAGFAPICLQGRSPADPAPRSGDGSEPIRPDPCEPD